MRAAIIGCGGRGRGHAAGYKIAKGVKIVACADPIESSRKEFAGKFDIPHVYADYTEMLAKESPEIVSVCTWPGLHRDMIVHTASTGVRAIHAEKPMAPTWGEAKEIYRACDDADVVITFCHQRRFDAAFVRAKQLVEDGAIGDLCRVEGTCPNMFDWGTHWFDMFFFYNNDQPAEWVIGQIDAEGTQDIFDVPCEGSGISWIRYQNGLEGLLTTGGVGMQGARNRLVGSQGTIEVSFDRDTPLRIRTSDSSDWKTPSRGVVPHSDATVCSVLDLVDALKAGREPELSGQKALAATELIFATYESSRRRGKVTLPLDVDDSALITMLREGVIKHGASSRT